MIFFRQTQKRTLFLWALFFSMVLLSGQDVKLHVHSLDHDQQHGHMGVGAAAEHLHRSEAHFSTDISHDDLHDEVVSEFDAGSYGLLKKVSSNVLALALLITLSAWLLPASCPQTFHRRRDKGAALPWRNHLSPPLRAPPL